MLARWFILAVAAAFVAPTAAQAAPDIVGPTPAMSRPSSTCEAAGSGDTTTIGCRIELSRAASERAVVVRLVVARPEAPCSAAKVIEFGSSARVALPQVEEGASKAPRGCQP